MEILNSIIQLMMIEHQKCFSKSIGFSWVFFPWEHFVSHPRSLLSKDKNQESPNAFWKSIFGTADSLLPKTSMHLSFQCRILSYFYSFHKSYLGLGFFLKKMVQLHYFCCMGEIWNLLSWNLTWSTNEREGVLIKAETVSFLCDLKTEIKRVSVELLMGEKFFLALLTWSEEARHVLERISIENHFWFLLIFANNKKFYQKEKESFRNIWASLISLCVYLRTQKAI